MCPTKNNACIFFFFFVSCPRCRKNGLEKTNGLRIDVIVQSPSPCSLGKHLSWAVEGEATYKIRREKKKPGRWLSWEVRYVSLCDFADLVSVVDPYKIWSLVWHEEFSCPWGNPENAYVRLHCSTSEKDLYSHLSSVNFEAEKLLGLTSDPDKTPVLRYVPLGV